jgi:thiol-disulfide isomerase/thioredoxin
MESPPIFHPSHQRKRPGLNARYYILRLSFLVVSNDARIFPRSSFPPRCLTIALGLTYNPFLERRTMSRLIGNEHELQEVMKTKDELFVLFYASWCPFSQRFLPVYEKFARDHGHEYARILVDHNEDLCDKYSIDVYPTVIFFKSGAISKRLDGAYHVGLDERLMADLIEACGPPTKRS